MVECGGGGDLKVEQRGYGMRINHSWVVHRREIKPSVVVVPPVFFNTMACCVLRSTSFRYSSQDLTYIRQMCPCHHLGQKDFCILDILVPDNTQLQGKQVEWTAMTHDQDMNLPRNDYVKPGP